MTRSTTGAAAAAGEALQVTLVRSSDATPARGREAGGDDIGPRGAMLVIGSERATPFGVGLRRSARAPRSAPPSVLNVTVRPATGSPSSVAVADTVWVPPSESRPPPASVTSPARHGAVSPSIDLHDPEAIVALRA